MRMDNLRWIVFGIVMGILKYRTPMSEPVSELGNNESFSENFYALNKYIRLFIYFLLFSASDFCYAQSIILLPDSASRGAAIETDPIYISAAKEIISALNRTGFKVTQSEAIPPPYMPTRRRPDSKDWRRVFQRKGINVNFLITLTVTRHIERSPVNRLKIGISTMLYEKNKGVRPIAMISEPTNTGWTVAPNCFAACLTELYAQHAKLPARSIGKKLIKALNYVTTRSTHLRINPKK